MFIQLTEKIATDNFPEMKKLIKDKEFHVKLVFLENGLEVTNLTTPEDVLIRTKQVYYDENYLGSFFRLVPDTGGASGFLSFVFDNDVTFMFWFNLPDYLRKDEKSFFMIQDGRLFFLKTSNLPSKVSLMYIITPIGPGNQEKFEAGFEIDNAQAAMGGSWNDVRKQKGLPPTKKFARFEK